MEVAEFLEKSPKNRDKSVFWSAERSSDESAKLPESVLGKKSSVGRDGKLFLRASGKRFLTSFIMGKVLERYSEILTSVVKAEELPPMMASEPDFCSGKFQARSVAEVSFSPFLFQ